jgi:fatty-acyl-CoA synthase
VGFPVPRHEVAVVDAHGTRCAERMVGEVLVRGPSVMQGYFRDPAATAAVLRDGWLHTGDLGYLADGELYLVGRAKDLIIVRGRNVYPEDLERTAETVAGVRGGGSVAFGVRDEDAAEERLMLVCETKVVDGAERRVVEARIRQAVHEAHDVTLHEVTLVAPGTIPKTSSGKRQRSRCRELYLRNALHPSRAAKRGGALVLVRGALGLGLVGLRRWLRRTRTGERTGARSSA